MKEMNEMFLKPLLLNHMNYRVRRIGLEGRRITTRR